MNKDNNKEYFKFTELYFNNYDKIPRELKGDHEYKNVKDFINTMKRLGLKWVIKKLRHKYTTWK